MQVIGPNVIPEFAGGGYPGSRNILDASKKMVDGPQTTNQGKRLEAKEIAASPSAPRNDGGRSFRLSRMTKLEVDDHRPRTTEARMKDKG